MKAWAPKTLLQRCELVVDKFGKKIHPGTLFNYYKVSARSNAKLSGFEISKPFSSVLYAKSMRKGG